MKNDRRAKHVTFYEQLSVTMAQAARPVGQKQGRFPAGFLLQGTAEFDLQIPISA